MKIAVGVLSIYLFLFANAASAQNSASDAEIAKDLSNPLSSLITLPLLLEYTPNIGSADGYNTTLNFQPVYPFELNDKLTLTTRTIIPLSHQNNIAGQSGTQFGLGDIEQAFFLVPEARETQIGNLSLGAGLQVTWPTSSDRLLGQGTLAVGPTAAAIVQKKGWTIGGLATQQWGVLDTRSNVPDLNTTFLEPFLAYTNSKQWTFATFTESEYDWTVDEWSVPITAQVSKLLRVRGKLPLQITSGVTYWAESPQGGPDGFGVRLQATVVLPKDWRKIAGSN